MPATSAPSRARDVGRLYAEIGYFDEQGVGDEELDGPDDRIRRLLQPAETADEDD